MIHPTDTKESGSAQRFLSLLVGGVLLLDLLVVALAVFSLWQSRVQYQQRAALQSSNLCQSLVYTVSGRIDAVDIALLAVSDQAERSLARGRIDGKSLDAYLARQHRRLPELDSICMANARGELAYGTDVVKGKSVADRDYFRQLRDNPAAGLVISKLLTGRISNKPIIVVARRVNYPDGTFAGIVSGSITVDRILKIISSIAVGPSGGITLRDSQMNVIVRYPQNGPSLCVDDHNAVWSELRKLVAEGVQRGTFHTDRTWDSVPRTISYRKVQRYPLYLLVGLGSRDYLAPWQHHLYRVSALVSIFLVTTLLLSRVAFLKWRRETAAEASLRRQKDQLELQVAERTRELSEANDRLFLELAEREEVEERVRRGRNLLALIIGSIPQAVFWKDRSSVYLGCNTVFAHAFGIEASEEIAGRTDLDLPWGARFMRRCLVDDREVMEGNHPRLRTIEQVEREDGSRLWLESSKLPLRDGAGQVYGLLAVYEDITERKQVEVMRNKALALVETLLSSSPTGVVVFEGERGDCVMANQAAADIVGGTVASIRASNLHTLAPLKDCGIYQLCREVLSDMNTRRFEASTRSSYGKEIHLDCFLSCFEVDDVRHLMIIMVDISEKRRLEEENRRIEAHMQHVQKLESLGVLAGGIAHDFSNILMVVLGNTELATLRLEPDSPVMENLRQIEDAATRAADLAKQMLAYSGKGQLAIKGVDLGSVVREMGQMLEVSISKKVTLCYSFSPDLPAIMADPSQLRQVILNLVLNASEAIGDENGTVTLRTTLLTCDSDYLSATWVDDHLPEGEYVLLEVHDTGCGIPADNVPKIFDPFFTTKFTGRGLGMAAVLGIVRGHGGAIKVCSEVGKGATFTLLFPAAGVIATPSERA